MSKTNFVVMLVVIILLGGFIVYSVQQNAQKTDTQKQIKELYIKSFQIAKGKTTYYYNYNEKINSYNNTDIIAKYPNGEYVEIKSVISEKKLYLFDNQTIMCVKLLDDNESCGEVDENANYVKTLSSLIFDDKSTEKTIENLKTLIYNKSVIQFIGQAVNKTIEGRTCNFIDYTLNYSVLSLSDAPKFGIGPSSPKFFRSSVCITDEGVTLYKKFDYDYLGSNRTNEFYLIEQSDKDKAKTLLDRPNITENITISDLVAQEIILKQQLGNCYAKPTSLEKDSCVFSMSFDLGYKELCNAAGAKSDICYINFAISQNNTGICQSVGSSEFKDDCYTEMAGKNKNQTFCNQINNVTKQTYCLNISK
ncbi:MAG: hypothetical protein AABX38_00845 [Candidatus Micrarchaeota archaeon]